MYNEKTKMAIDKWRETHKDAWSSYHNMKEKKRYNNNKESILIKNKEKYEYKRFLYNTNPRIEFELFRNIEL